MKRVLEKYKSASQQVRASFWFVICVFLQKGISVITTPIFTRLLTTAEYGHYNVFNSWLEIIAIFVTLKLTAGVYLQGLVKFHEQRKEYSSTLQGLTLTLVLAWTIIYLVFSDFWNSLFSLTTVQMLAMLLIIWASAAFNFWAVSQREALKYRNLVIVTLLISIAKPVISVIFVINAQDKVTAMILGLALVEVIGYTGFFFVQMHSGKKFVSKEFWKYALMFNIPLVPHYLSTTVLNSTDRIMISKMIGSSEAGMYSLSYQLSQVMTIFSIALLQTIQPWLYRKIKEKRIEEISKVSYPLFLIIAGIEILAMFFAPEILAVFAPLSYRDAVWVIPPVTISVFFTFAYTMFASFEFYYEKTKYIATATIIGAILNLILNYIFIQKYGFLAAGYTTLFCYMLFALFHFLFMQKICKDYLDNQKPYNTKILLLIVGVLLLCGVAALITYNYIVLRYLLLVVFALILILKRMHIIREFKEILDIKTNKK